MATLLRLLLVPVLGPERVPFITYFLAVVITAWYGGLGPALLVVISGSLLAAYFFIPPNNSVVVPELGDVLSLAIYVVIGALIALLSDALHRARMRAEANAAALRDSEQSLLVTLNSIGDAVIATDTRGLVVLMNPVAEGLTGWNFQEAKGKPLAEVFNIVNEDTREPVADPVTRALESGNTVGLANHTVLISRDGKEVPIDDSAAPMRAPERGITGVVLTFRDISERRQARRAMRESENRFHILADTAPVLLWMSGTDTLADFFNKPWLEYAGRTMGQELKNGWTEGLHPDDYQRYIDVYLRSFEGREPFTIEYRLRRFDGEYRWVLSNGVPRYTIEGEFAGYIGSCVDIHDRKRAEESLRFLAEASGVLASSPDYELTLQNLARLTVPLLADYCVIYIIEDDGKVFRAAAAHGDPEKERLLAELNRYPLDINKEGAAASLYRRGEAVIIPNVDELLLSSIAQSSDHLRMIRELKSSSAMIVPLIARERTLGSLALVMSESGRQCDPADLTLAEDLARRAATAVDNARLYRDNREARQRLSFLVRASEVLVASLDYETTLEGTVRLPIPDFADWCIIDALEEDGRISRVAVAAADPMKRETLLQMQKAFPPDWNSPHPSVRALRSGEPLLITEMSEEQVKAGTVNAAHAALVRKISPRSLLCVPLVAHGKALGVICFALSESGRVYTEKDLSLAKDIARRAAVAVDNARL
ncbi:MAG TPA: PAS domain S-box protein, partial [Blastocatellia bacterium]|nr:PAS domain S-box protein [Blastocatellia bacterium]